MENAFISRLTQIIEANISDPKLGVDELARKMGMSYISLHRKLRSLTGKSINQYIREIRLNKARKLLQDESLTVFEVAFRTGFSSAAYFSTCFHTYFGYPPGDARGVEESGERAAPAGVADSGVWHTITGKNEKRTRRLIMAGSAVLLAAAGIVILLSSSAETRERKSIAVLPFKSLSPQGEIFTSGFYGQVVGSLAKVNVFDVRYGASTGLYQDGDKTIPEIGKELDADYIATGSVSLEGKDLKVRIELFEAKTNIQLQTDTLSCLLNDAFTLLPDICKYIAYQLHTYVLPREQAAISEKCTKSAEAWNHCLESFYWIDFKGGSDPIKALACIQKAIDLDTMWIDAYGFKANYLGYLYEFYDPREETMRESFKQLKKCFEVDYGFYREWGSTIMGFNYLRLRQYDKVLKYLRWEQKQFGQYDKLPVYYRVTGQWKKSVKTSSIQLKLWPDHYDLTFNQGVTFEFLRDFPDALYYFTRASGLCPENIRPYVGLANYALKTQADTHKAREILEKAIPFDNFRKEFMSGYHYQMALIDLYEGNYESALSHIALYEEIITSVLVYYHFQPKFKIEALAYGLLNRPDLERACYDSARRFIENRLEKFPDLKRHPEKVSSLGVAWAGLGNRNKALEMIHRVEKLLTDSPDAFFGPYAMEDVAWIYTKIGDYPKALKILKKALSEPGPLTGKLLEMDPKWNTLREQREFPKLVRKYSKFNP